MVIVGATAKASIAPLSTVVDKIADACHLAASSDARHELALVLRRLVSPQQILSSSSLLYFPFVIPAAFFHL